MITCCAMAPDDMKRHFPLILLLVLTLAPADVWPEIACREGEEQHVERDPELGLPAYSCFKHGVRNGRYLVPRADNKVILLSVGYVNGLRSGPYMRRHRNGKAQAHSVVECSWGAFVFGNYA